MSRIWPFVYVIFISVLTALPLSPVSAATNTLFEGYYKLTLAGQHVGFFILKYEYDSQKEEFQSTTFLRTNALANNIQESLKARATKALVPIAYQYTTVVGGTPKVVDASFKNQQMTGSILVGQQKQSLSLAVPQGAFLSTFLTYIMLQSPKGITTGQKYNYQAIAEEDGQLHNGQAYVQGEEAYRNVKAFKILNEFKGAQFINWVNTKGETLKTDSPAQNLQAELVPNPGEATQGIPYNAQSLKTLFGNIPQGKTHMLTGASSPSAAPSSKAGDKGS